MSPTVHERWNAPRWVYARARAHANGQARSHSPALHFGQQILDYHLAVARGYTEPRVLEQTTSVKIVFQASPILRWEGWFTGGQHVGWSALESHDMCTL
jgi:hypothetical protein